MKTNSLITKKEAQPVPYKDSIHAAFERQRKGKNCPICLTNVSLASYRSHLDGCKVDSNDDECLVVASYTREEAILLRAGPEIVLNDSTCENERERTEKAVTIPYNDIKEISGGDVKERRRSKRIKLTNENITMKDIIEEIENITNKKYLTDSIYLNNDYVVRFTLRILRKVLTTKRFDGRYYDETFWNIGDLEIIKNFVFNISAEARLLLVRLFLRRPTWYEIKKLESRYTEILDIRNASKDLLMARFIEDDSSLKNLEEALNLADLSILKTVARQFKINGTARNDLIKSIQEFSNKQKSLFGVPGCVTKSIMRCLKKHLGMCVRIKEECSNFFKAIYTVYCPMSTNSGNNIDDPKVNTYQDMLFNMLNMQNNSIKYPSPNPCPNISSFFTDRQQLIDYVDAKNLESCILMTMLTNLNGAFQLTCNAKNQVDLMDQDKIKIYSKLPLHERRFTSLYVLIRCCGHGANILEKMKNYGLAVEWYKYILMNNELKEMCRDIRGIWWNRMALNLDVHLKDKDVALNMIYLAMDDQCVMEKEKLMLQDRAVRLTKSKFQFVINLCDFPATTIISTIISKNLGDGRLNRFVENTEGEEIEYSVEEIVRRRYLKNEGFNKGIHDEGLSWHMLFRLLFYDIIFDTDEHPDTWLSEFQLSPLDINYTLYEKRKSNFDKRFEWLELATDDDVVEKIHHNWNDKKMETINEFNRNYFGDNSENFVEFFKCIPRSSLISILRRLCLNYRNCRSGFPDLTLWNTTNRSVAVVEVKGPGDKLSTKQRLWLSHFTKCGIRAEVCHVKAENKRRLS